MWTPGSGSRTPARITIDLVTPPSLLTPGYKGSGSVSPRYSWTPAYNGSVSVSPGSVSVSPVDLTGVDAGVLSSKLLALVQPLDISKLPSWGSGVVVLHDYSLLPRDVWRLFLDWLLTTGAEHDVFTIRRLCRACRRHVDEYLPFWLSFGVPKAEGYCLSKSVIRDCADVHRERLMEERRTIVASSTSLKQKISRREMKIAGLKREKRALASELETNEDTKREIDGRLSEIKTAFKFKRAKKTVKK